MSNQTQTLIQAISAENTAAADSAFKDAIMTKVITALDVKRVELASTVYNKDAK